MRELKTKLKQEESKDSEEIKNALAALEIEGEKIKKKQKDFEHKERVNILFFFNLIYLNSTTQS